MHLIPKRRLEETCWVLCIVVFATCTLFTRSCIRYCSQFLWICSDISLKVGENMKIYLQNIYMTFNGFCKPRRISGNLRHVTHSPYPFSTPWYYTSHQYAWPSKEPTTGSVLFAPSFEDERRQRGCYSWIPRHLGLKGRVSPIGEPSVFIRLVIGCILPVLLDRRSWVGGTAKSGPRTGCIRSKSFPLLDHS